MMSEDEMDSDCSSPEDSPLFLQNLGNDSNLEPIAHMRASPITPGTEKDKKKLPTLFKWEGEGQNACIAGSFDGWATKIPMVKSDGDFYTVIELNEGTHQYKFIVDGQWVCNPNELQIPNGLGTKNNVMTVKASDFEVFEALAMDSISTGHKCKGPTGSPPGDYTEDIPPCNHEMGYHNSRPPILPPHLLEIILNKEISLHCDPTLLPEPNHVMLNHLYALSIKDGFMVLSATHRYRKKYVTTLLYKPT